MVVDGVGRDGWVDQHSSGSRWQETVPTVAKQRRRNAHGMRGMYVRQKRRRGEKTTTCTYTTRDDRLILTTIAPPQKKAAILFNERFMAARHEEGSYEEKVFISFLGCKTLSNDDIEVSGGTGFEEIRPGAGFKTGDFVKETLGGLP